MGLGLPQGVQRGDIAGTERLIILLHETIHYLQDLALGTSINQDLILDEMAHHTFGIVNSHPFGQVLLCPLTQHDYPPDSDSSAAIHHISEKESLLTDLIYQSYSVDTGGSSRLPRYVKISSLELIEGIAAVKTMLLMARAARDEKDLAYLGTVRDRLPIMPSTLPETYSLAPRIFDATIGQGFFGEEIWSPRRWPHDSRSPCDRLFIDTAFLHIAEIALHIPPYMVISDKLKEGGHDIEHFTPALRFFEMIAELQKFGGFPDRISTNQDDYHRELYDWFAHRLGWLGYIETQGAWESLFLTLRDQTRGCISDGYRYRMIVERSLRSSGVLYGNPLEILASQGVPILHETPQGFKLLRAIATNKRFLLVPYEFSQFPDPWFAMQMPAVKWKNAPKESVDMEYELNRWIPYFQEIVFRAMCRSVQAAIFRGRSLECPWSGGVCKAAQERCRRLTRLSDLPTTECALRPYLRHTGLDRVDLQWS